MAAWEVRPDSASIAASAASTPASLAASTDAEEMPEVSWVWKWIGMVISSLSARTSAPAAAGLTSPPMSLMHRTCAPSASSSFAIFT